MFSNTTARLIRRSILTMSYKAHSAHIPSAFSMCDYLGVLFDREITPEKYRFVFGKPFGAQAYYALFAYMGWIPDDLSKYGTMDPEWRYIIQKEHPLVSFIDETMGNCLSVACGIALAGHKVFVNISDAAFQEGTIWESALFAGSHHLSSIVMSVDYNNMQALGRIIDILDLDSLEEKLKSFGWYTFSCNGHDIESMYKTVEKMKNEKRDGPTAIIFKTEKGHGLSFMEHDPRWHYGVLDNELYNQAMKELL